MSSPDQKLEQIVSYLRTEFSPLKIYLFGSRAKGTAHADSDYDFVVVTAEKKFEKWGAFNKARRDIYEKFGAQADIWVYSSEQFENLLQDFGSMPETALNTGIEV
jgi:predicted nucleotidyltransferase